MRYKVPKFHLPPHVPACQAPFSFNFATGVGRTDGEGVERNWSWLNGAAASTSQMGPGSRHDTLDDYMGFSNFRKVTELGKFFFLSLRWHCLLIFLLKITAFFVDWSLPYLKPCYIARLLRLSLTAYARNMEHRLMSGKIWL
jgi:hypothetical protein